MKAILEFNLPEEQLEFELSCNGRKYEAILSSLSREMRKIVKFDESISNDYRQAVGDMRDMLRELVNEYAVDLD